jgi:thiamine biosynthesis protein ThiI
MRRMMYRIATEVCKRNHYKAIINGESIGQVASQTLDSIGVIETVSNMPIIRPVACMDKLEIIDIANEIGTYETSILPYEDCCTIFLPKHPIIKPKLDKCLDIEKRFDYESLIKETVDNIEIIDNLDEEKSDLL